MVPRLSDKFQKWSLVVGDGGGGDDDDDDDYDNTKAWLFIKATTFDNIKDEVNDLNILTWSRET